MDTETKQEGANGKTTALAVVRDTRAMTYEPRDIGEGITLADQLARSCLLGRNLDTPEKVFAVIVAGRELGLSAMTSLRSIHLVEGKPVMAADTILGLVRASGLCASFQLIEGTDRVATYEARRRDTGDTARLSFSWDDATRAGLAGKDNWRKYPATMLRHRAAAMLARELFPDVVLNVYEQGEEDEIRGSRTEVLPSQSAPMATSTIGIGASKPAPAPRAEPAKVTPPPAARTTTLPGGSTVTTKGGPKPKAEDFTFKVGKHKGSKASEVPTGYLEWYADAKLADPSKWEGKTWEADTRREIRVCQALIAAHEAGKEAAEAPAARPADEPPPPEAPEGDEFSDNETPF